MNFPELNIDSVNEQNAVKLFMEYWSSRYFYNLESVYTENIGKELTPERLNHLFEWKNGGKISQRKLKSIQNNYSHNRIKNIDELKGIYLNQNYLGGPIWNIFYVHCVKPKIFPIFDQHTYRAMFFIKEKVIKEIPKAKKEIYKIYNDEYIPFYDNFDIERRKIDKALFTYGQYLKAIKRFV